MEPIYLRDHLPTKYRYYASQWCGGDERLLFVCSAAGSIVWMFRRRSHIAHSTERSDGTTRAVALGGFTVSCDLRPSIHTVLLQTPFFQLLFNTMGFVADRNRVIGGMLVSLLPDG